MSLDHLREALEILAIEEADAWFEYLEAVREEAQTARYDEIESWAWARLRQRLRAVDAKRSDVSAAAA